ncbi:asparagine--tRNA ligase [Spirochaeta cellobiosiphila]|uniref:asparagine--tRNA ligase n=1 Tax=Spirochaeta cellobiosiphila TaxID=504483 RepID=UPI0004097E33|nr:asparagine--tRNA ligase [Spirochaeta cellobiosiphila]
MSTKKIKEILVTTPSDQAVIVQGWCRTKRDSKNHAFLELNDGSSLKNIQIFIDKSKHDFEDLSKISTGASVWTKGLLVESPGQNQAVELHADELAIIGEAPAADYPLQKKRHSFEFLRDIAHLRTRTNTFGAVMRVRNALSYAVHQYFQNNSFQYVHTPIITASDCEGAGEMFQVTTMDLNKLPLTEDKQIDYSHDFFGKEAHLTVSGQLNVETYAMALGDVYTFGPTFRAENSNTSRHLAEFWMIEPEMSFCDIEGNMDRAEDFLKFVLSYVLENCQEDMAFFNQWIEKGIIDNLKSVINSEFHRISYTEAIDQLLASGKKFEFPIKWGEDLQSEHEKYLTEELYKGPVIVTDYPKEIKAFYMKLNDDNKTVRAMDVLVPRLGEIIGGSEREWDYDKLLSRIKAAGLNEEDYWWYLDLRKYGSVPHSGFGLGFERLVQYVTGMQNIRDVIPFPRYPGNAEF